MAFGQRSAVAVVVMLLASACENGQFCETDTLLSLTPLTPSEAPLLDLEEVFRFLPHGADSVPSWDIRAVAKSPQGTLYAGSGRDAKVLQFDRQGRYVRTLGEAGSGPGEFRRINRLWLAGDTLVVLDPSLRRTTLIRVDASAEILTVLEHRSLLPWPRPWTSGPDGWIAREKYSTEIDRVDQLATALPVRVAPTRVFRAFDPESGSAADTLFTIDSPRASVLRDGLPVDFYDLPLFENGPNWDFDRRGRLYVTSPDEYRVDISLPGGRLVRQVSRNSPAKAVSPGEVRRLRRSVRRIMECNPILSATTSAVLEDIELRSEGFPIRETVSPLGTIVVGPSGSFWVERWDAYPLGMRDFDRDLIRAPWPWKTRWDVFDSLGVFLGTAETPQRFTPLYSEGISIGGVEKDELMREFLVEYRLEGSQ